MDEVSPLGPTRVLEIRQGRLTGDWSIDPVAAGFGGVAPDDLAGGSPEENAAVIEAVLGGGGPPGARAAVLLNAAAALYVAGLEPGYPSALRRATAALDDGAGRRTLEALRRVYQN
jgi:anthranilate phosphoribosyltransferase